MGGTGAWPIDVEAAPRPTARAARTTERIVIDGLLDEPAWQATDSIGGFIQSQPDAGYSATEPTVVRILYDDHALYIAAHCFDSDVSQLVVQTLEKDFPGQSTRDADIFSLTLDTFYDRKNSFIYLINPYGAVRDGQTFDDSRDVNFAWDGVSEVRTRIHDWGWSLEMAIPWTTLRFDPARAEQIWGVNFLRRVRRKNEDSYWAPQDRRDPVHRMSKAGTLTGMVELRPGRNLSITPYAASGRSSGSLVAPAESGTTYTVGGDLKYGLTPQLTLDLTYNTDFSQVEVDQEQVNLTRFSLFFPEKRDFFVENSGVFTFGDISEREYRMGASLRDFTLFHSRRIGLSGGRPVPILGGGRLTGRAGGFEVGLLNMQTDATVAVPGENFTVARARRSLAEGADVGVIFVNRQATGVAGGQYNRSYGADFSARAWSNLIISSYVAATDASAVEGDDGRRAAGTGGENTAARIAVGWRDRLWDATAFIKHVGESFNPGVGYIRRTGMRHAYATLGVHPQRPLPFLQEINPYLELDYITSPSSVLETRNGTLGMDVQFPGGSTLNVTASDRFERLYEPFSVGGEGVVPVGDFAFREGSLRYHSDPARALSGDVRLTGGGFFHGTRASLGAGALWRPSYRLAFDVSVDHNDISLPRESFTADVLGARIRYAHSTKLFGSAFVQYNAAVEQMVANVRLNFIHAPLSDLFLVV